MLTYKNIGYAGRLGNQLFQIAVLKIVSYVTGYEIVLPADTFLRYHHGQKNLLENFNIKNIRYGDLYIKYLYSERKNIDFDKRIFTVPDNTNFEGYFQNAKYYTPYQNDLIRDISINDKVEKKINEILKRYKNNKVSIHIRRGDYSDGSIASHANFTNDASKNSPLINYYKHALSIIPTNSTIFLFTGGSHYNGNQSDIEWCKQYIRDDRVVYVDFLNDIESFCFIKNCDINIISYMSSFSWWSAFLNTNKKVIAPYNYYPFEYTDTTIDDFCPSTWNFIKT